MILEKVLKLRITTRLKASSKMKLNFNQILEKCFKLKHSKFGIDHVCLVQQENMNHDLDRNLEVGRFD